MRCRGIQIMLLIARCLWLTNDVAIIREFYLPLWMHVLILLWGLFRATPVFSGAPFPRHSLLWKRFSGLSEQRKVSKAWRMGRVQKANMGQGERNGCKRTLILPPVLVLFSFSFSWEQTKKVSSLVTLALFYYCCYCFRQNGLCFGSFKGRDRPSLGFMRLLY